MSESGTGKPNELSVLRGCEDHFGLGDWADIILIVQQG